MSKNGLFLGIWSGRPTPKWLKNFEKSRKLSFYRLNSYKWSQRNPVKRWHTGKFDFLEIGISIQFCKFCPPKIAISPLCRGSTWSVSLGASFCKVTERFEDIGPKNENSRKKNELKNKTCTCFVFFFGRFFKIYALFSIFFWFTHYFQKKGTTRKLRFFAVDPCIYYRKKNVYGHVFLFNSFFFSWIFIFWTDVL